MKVVSLKKQGRKRHHSCCCRRGHIEEIRETAEVSKGQKVGLFHSAPKSELIKPLPEGKTLAVWYPGADQHFSYWNLRAHRVQETTDSESEEEMKGRKNWSWETSFCLKILHSGTAKQGDCCLSALFSFNPNSGFQPVVHGPPGVTGQLQRKWILICENSLGVHKLKRVEKILL